MKRRVLFILLLLVAGAIVNVAVAWLHPYMLPTMGVADRPRQVSVRMRYRDGTGLPMRAIRWRTDAGLTPGEILWAGFVIDTVVYAVVIGCLVTAARAFERRERMQHGLCPKCAYPVGTSDVCTECGAAVTATSPKTQDCSVD